MFSKYYQYKCYSVFLLSISIILIKLPNFLISYKKNFKHCFTRVYKKETERGGCVCPRRNAHACVIVCILKSENNFQQSGLSFHCRMWESNSGHQAYTLNCIDIPLSTPFPSLNNKNIITTLHISFTFIYLRETHKCTRAVRGQCPRVGALLLSCGSQGYNSDPGAWQQMPLTTEPSCNPHTSILSVFFLSSFIKYQLSYVHVALTHIKYNYL